MKTDSLVLVKGDKTFKVTVMNYDVVIESEVPSLIGKLVASVWKLARRNNMKVYFEEFLPKTLVM